MRPIGLDPGLARTGWGVIESDGARLSFVACGTVRGDARAETAQRLRALFDGVARAIDEWRPDSAAVEETFVNRNPASALQLGLARGVALLAPARAGLPVAEYHNLTVKKALVGAARADKAQVAAMVRRLLPAARPDSPDASDALAVAICHAHRAATLGRFAAAGTRP